MSGETAEGGAVATMETPLDRFRAHLFADPSLQRDLQACRDRGDFVELAVDTARARGIELSPDAVDRAMPGPLPDIWETASARDMPETPLPPRGWLPVRAFWRGNGLWASWSYFGDERLGEPFFEGDVRRALARPFNQFLRYVTPVARLAERSPENPGLKPSGLIFHLSRCGSTLVAQMLAALDRTIVISEASPLDAVVQADRVRPGLAADEQSRWLASMAGALAAPRAGERRAFLKLDCWHTLALPLFLSAFPDVPWVFLYRDPVEVLVSQLAMPGAQMIPGMVRPDLFGLDDAYDPRRPADYYARALMKICAPVLEHHSAGHSLLINYRQLPEAVWTMILPHFGLAISEPERAAMAAAARRDAKTPGFEFAADSEAKQRAASDAVRAAADDWLGETYAALERLSRADPRSA